METEINQCDTCDGLGMDPWCPECKSSPATTELSRAHALLTSAGIPDGGCLLQAAEQRAAELQRDVDALSLVRKVSDSEMNALLKRANKEFLARAEAVEEVLRAIASALSVGGYNAETVDADVFHRKITDGIDGLTRPLVQRVAEAERQLRELRAAKQSGELT